MIRDVKHISDGVDNDMTKMGIF